MTDKDIIKALEELRTTLDDGYSTALEYGGKRDEWIEKEIGLLCDALDLISRLQAENERLDKELIEEKLRKQMLHYTVEEIKADAIKDYKERLIFEIVNTPTKYQESGLLYSSGVANRQNEIIDIINGLDEKEMVGEE